MRPGTVCRVRQRATIGSTGRSRADNDDARPLWVGHPALNTMTKRDIDRLMVMSYGALVAGIINSRVESLLSRQTRDSWSVLLPLISLNLIGAGLALFC